MKVWRFIYVKWLYYIYIYIHIPLDSFNNKFFLQDYLIKLIHKCNYLPLGAAVEFIKELEDVEVPESFSGELECEVFPEDVEGKWYHGDVELTSSLKYVIASRRGRQTLTIKDVNKDDQGEYSYVVDGKRTQCKLKMKRKHFLYCLYTVDFLYYSMCYSYTIVSQNALMFNILPLMSIN